MQTRIQIAAGLILLASLPVSVCKAQDKNYQTAGDSSTVHASGDGWTVFRTQENCSALISYERDSVLYVSYTFGTNSAYMSITDPSFRSIVEGQKYPVRIHFRTGTRIDSGWGDRSMTGFILDDGSKGISTTLNGRDLLEDLRNEDSLFITRDDDEIIVISLSLKGSKAMISSLERCSREAQKENPADPFAG